jgi:hypothetical protein
LLLSQHGRHSPAMLHSKLAARPLRALQPTHCVITGRHWFGYNFVMPCC